MIRRLLLLGTLAMLCGIYALTIRDWRRMVHCGTDESGGNCQALLNYHSHFDTTAFIVAAVVFAVIILLPSLKSPDR